MTPGAGRILLDGMLAPPVVRTFTLEDAAEAHRHIASRTARGKLVLIP